MKKIITIMAIAAIAVFLSGSMLMGEGATRKDDNEVRTTVPGWDDFAGKWYLSSNTEIAGLEKVFPDIYAFGNELEIMPDGRISWHIGAAGAAGTYEVYDNQLVACVTDIMEDDEVKIALTLKDGELSMKYKAVPLVFTK
ncbi:MAG: hypothetical protein K6G58_09805 [Lachnospiraceae bacterium]|nr:hypothetical protein [Lachnospiraceae bacterium]